MAQLNFYVPDTVEKVIRAEAKSCGKSISQYLADMVKSWVRYDQWQKNFFKQVAGAWKGDKPEIESLDPEEHEAL